MQLETNCCDIPPRDIWQKKRETARDVQAELYLFPSQSRGNSKWLFSRCRGDSLSSQTSPLQTAVHIYIPFVHSLLYNWVLLYYLTFRNNTSGFFSSFLLLCEFTSSSAVLRSPSLPQPSALHADYVISVINGSLPAGVKNTSLVSARIGLLSAAAAHRSWTELFILTIALVWGNKERRRHPALVFTAPGGLL